jgi:hypothetical protein
MRDLWQWSRQCLRLAHASGSAYERARPRLLSEARVSLNGAALVQEFNPHDAMGSSFISIAGSVMRSGVTRSLMQQSFVSGSSMLEAVTPTVELLTFSVKYSSS